MRVCFQTAKHVEQLLPARQHGSRDRGVHKCGLAKHLVGGRCACFRQGKKLLSLYCYSQQSIVELVPVHYLGICTVVPQIECGV